MFFTNDRGLQCPISWRSKKQTATAYSTVEAEVVAASDGLRMLSMPVVGTLQEISGAECVAGVMMGDAQVAERCIRTGWSQTLT